MIKISTPPVSTRSVSAAGHRDGVSAAESIPRHTRNNVVAGLKLQGVRTARCSTIRLNPASGAKPVDEVKDRLINPRRIVLGSSGCASHGQSPRVADGRALLPLDLHHGHRRPDQQPQQYTIVIVTITYAAGCPGE